KAGTYSGSVTARDRSGNTLRLPFRLMINAITITTVDLPPAEPEKDYFQQLAATGGKPPYRWRLLSNIDCIGLTQQPPIFGPFRIFYGGGRSSGDLTIDGLLTIEAQNVFDQRFCVQVTDAAGSVALSEVRITPPP